MKISGHVTESIRKRNNIGDSTNLHLVDCGSRRTLIEFDGSREGTESRQRISPLVSITEQPIFERVLLALHEFPRTTGETFPSTDDETNVATCNRARVVNARRCACNAS